MSDRQHRVRVSGVGFGWAVGVAKAKDHADSFSSAEVATMIASLLEKRFKITERGSSVLTEIRGGTVAFLTTAYILAVNAAILSDSGGPCSSEDCTPESGQEFACRFFDQGYEECVDDVRTSLVTATAASALLACLLMGFGANLPLVLAPGMGLNAYFAYNVVGFRGKGTVKYGTALAAIFVEGWIFVILSITGARGKIISYFPKSVMLASSAGIGFFLTHIGLQNGQGLGVVTFEPATLVTLGGCPVEKQVPMYAVGDTSFEAVCLDETGNNLANANLGPSSPNYQCLGDRMEASSVWLGIAGGAIIAFMLMKGVKGAVMVGIIFVTVISWIPGHSASYLGEDSAVPGGQGRMDEFKKVVALPTLKGTGGHLDFEGFAKSEVWVALFTFLYVDFLDTTGTLFSMATHMNNYIPGFVDTNGQFEGSTFAFLSDGLATVFGALMGTSPVTTYIESASGIREGARTGLAAIVAAFWFFVSLFFSPLLKSIPPYATGPALILVGSLMMINVAKIDWNRTQDAIPAFLTIALMPLTYSIAYGIIAGVVSWIVLNGLDWLVTQAGWVTPQEEGKQAPGAKQNTTVEMGMHTTKASETSTV